MILLDVYCLSREAPIVVRWVEYEVTPAAIDAHGHITAPMQLAVKQHDDDDQLAYLNLATVVAVIARTRDEGVSDDDDATA